MTRMFDPGHGLAQFPIGDEDQVHPCPHCGGMVRDDVPVDFGGCCSEECRLVVEEGYWPSPVGPATHDEMQGWVDELEARSAPAPEEEPPDE